MISSIPSHIVIISLFILTADSTHQGLYTHHLKTAKLVVPRKVNHLGETVSHVLTHHHETGIRSTIHEDHKRLRRNAPRHFPSQLHYHLDIDEDTLHLELEPSTASFVAPLMVVERHRRDVRTRVRPTEHINCHYQGQVRGHDQSRVALSACNGLTGVLRTNRSEYWIEPSKNHLVGPNGEHPHVLFKRADVKETPSTSKKSYKSANKPKRKRKRKKRHLTNCGTREPRRLTETRLEWQHQGKAFFAGSCPRWPKSAKSRRLVFR